MNVVDSSAWLAYFAGDANAAHFALPIEKTDQLLVPSITLTEVFKSVLRQVSEHAALEVIAQMRRGRVVDLDAGLAVDAATFGHTLKLPLADSIIYATAQQNKALVWTQDADFDGLPGVKYFKQR